MNARCFAVFGVGLLAAAAPGQTPLGTAFTYQGRLENAGGPVNGLHDLRFRLYDVPAGGAPLGATQCFDNVNVADGVVTQSLDFGAQFAGQERFLEIEVRADSGRDCTNAAGFVVLNPRQALTAAPNALNADRLDGLDSSAFLQAVPVPLTLSGTSNTQIIRAENASTGFLPIAIYGLCSGASGGATGIRGESASTNGRGVIGFATAASGAAFGGQFESTSISGRGVWGVASATSGETYGVFGQSASADGRGVHGLAGSGTGVFGESTNGDGVYGTGHYGGRFEGAGGGSIGVSGTGFTGVRGSGFIGGDFESTTCVGIGVKGVAWCPTDLATGVQGASHSTSGRGVAGFASATSGTNNGVYGSSASPSGRGVYGRSTENIGVYGEADGTTGTNYGVYGESAGPSGRGVNGVATAATGTNYGVRGANSNTAGYAVYASGDTGASGTKAFRIDHPFDPENKYLLHYAAESPEVINFYSGKVALDARGEAVISLPAYFASINKDPRYTLTAVGAPMPMLHVAEEISEEALKSGEAAGAGDAPPTCSFRIAGGVAGARVSWEVKALRNDLRMRLHGAPVEREKTGPERGKYQHPEYYSQPPEMGMDYDARHERPAPPTSPAATSD